MHFGIDSMRPGPAGVVNTLVHKACLELGITHIESLCNLESLLETLSIVVVVEPSQTVHHALGWCQKPQCAQRRLSLRELLDGSVANLHRPWWELDQELCVRVNPVPSILSEAKLFHGGIGLAREAWLDEVEIVRLVRAVGID